MLDEKWTHWQPIEALSKRYYLESITDDDEGLSLLFIEEKNQSNKLRLLFGYSADAYRKTYETYRSKLIHEVDEKYGGDFYGNRTFFKIENSSYVKWLSETSYNISDSHNFMHFAFFTDNFVIDVLALRDPKIEFLTSYNKIDDSKYKKLIFSPMEFYSTEDEDQFFNWINSIDCIIGYQKIDSKLHINVSSEPITAYNYKNLVGLFKRYKLENPEQLKELFYTEENKDWFEE